MPPSPGPEEGGQQGGTLVEAGPSSTTMCLGDGPHSLLDLTWQLRAATAAHDAMSAKIEALEGEVRSLQGERVVEGPISTALFRASTTASASRTKEATLLLLPQNVAELVVSKVVGKNSLRCTCRSLRLAVDACASGLT